MRRVAVIILLGSVQASVNLLPTHGKGSPLAQRPLFQHAALRTQLPFKKAYATKNSLPYVTRNPGLPLAQSASASMAKALLSAKAEDRRNDVASRRGTLLAKAASDASADKPQKVDVTGNVFNLIKNIVGAGVLSLPAGVAAIGGDPKLLLPAVTAVVIMGVLSAYTFYSIGRQCGIQKVSTYNEAWAKSVGEGSKWVATAIAFTYPILGCLAYSLIIGDMFSSLAKGGILGPMLQASALATDRRTWILGITAAALYPLCSLKKLGALAVTSLLGTMAVIYTGVFMTVRYFDSSYLTGGALYELLKASSAKLPAFAASGGDLLSGFTAFLSNPKAFILVAMLGTAFMAHPNAPLYFDEAGRDNNKFKRIVTLGFGASILLTIVFMVSGFLTFGSSSSGLILNSYAKSDALASVARAVLGLSVVFTYPLIFAGFKPIARGIVTRFNGIKEGPILEQALTVLPLVLITTIAVIVSNVGTVNAFKGAICGSSLIYIFPSLMYLMSSLPTVKNPVEKFANLGLLLLGSVMGAAGVAQSWATYVR